MYAGAAIFTDTANGSVSRPGGPWIAWMLALLGTVPARTIHTAVQILIRDQAVNAGHRGGVSRGLDLALLHNPLYPVDGESGCTDQERENGRHHHRDVAALVRNQPA